MTDQTTDNGFVDVKLKRPLNIAGAEVTMLRMREPTEADQLAIDDIKGGDTTREITLMANLCEIAPDDVKKLTLHDYKEVQKAFLGFIG